jgi:hypothetical protein
MTGSDRLDPKCGPFANLWLTYSATLDGLAKGCEPAALGLSRYNLELMTLALRRTQAWLERPVRLAGARTPHDVMNEHVRFWQTAGAHYAESSQRLLSALFAAATPPAGARDGDGKAARDYIAVSEVKAAPAARPVKDRRAA